MVLASYWGYFIMRRIFQKMSGGRKRYIKKCPFCPKILHDLRRHLLKVHNVTKDKVKPIMASKRKIKDSSALKFCQEEGCGAAVIRLDSHLRNVHKIFNIPVKFGKLQDCFTCLTYD